MRLQNNLDATLKSLASEATNISWKRAAEHGAKDTAKWTQLDVDSKCLDIIPLLQILA